MPSPILTARTLTRALLIASVLAALACGDDDDHDGSGSGRSDGKRDAAVARDAATASDPAGGGKCRQDEMCDYTCREGCEVECLGARCTAECPEGGCSLDADLGAQAAYDCAGGDCEIDCDGASECSVGCSGGGCTIGCDGGSSCKISCGTQGDPCQVTCGAGAQASCDNDHCELSGCEPCDPMDVDPSYTPSLDPADYTTTIDNPLYPLPPGAVWKYEAEDELITVEVLDETYTTASGVECVVVHDWSTDRDGVLLEDTRDYFAQDLDGNVWYFGEDTAELVNGKKANTRGSWEAGKDGALPGVVMFAKTPAIGTQYKEEYDRCEAEDLAELLAVGETVKAPTGEYHDCIRIHDYSAIEPAANEQKLFCPGVGLVLTYELAPGETDPGDPVETLTKVSL